MLGSVMFVMKNKVQTLERELVSLNRGIQEDIKVIHVLKAEWSHLNSPARLRELAQRHIQLNPIQAEQIINFSALPFEYENGSADLDDKKLTARRKINSRAEQNKNLKVLIAAQ
jgi:hypothetical protein